MTEDGTLPSGSPDDPLPDDPQSVGRSIGRGLLWGLLLGAILIILLATWTRQRQGAPEAALPILGQVPAFSLTDRDGGDFSLADLAGHPWVADTIFTRCTLVCPTMTARMARLDQRLPAATKLVSVSLDPGHDTPEVLEDWARSYEASDRWHFLTGPSDGIHALVRDGFKLGVAAAPEAETLPPGEAIVHSNRFVLVDGRGRIRGYYDSSDLEALETLVNDLGRLGD